MTDTNRTSQDVQWDTYDELVGPELDPSLWEPFSMGTGPLLEPDARTTVADGVWTIDIPEFKNFDRARQGLDNCKHVVFSSRTFPIPENGVGRFGVDLHAVHAGDGDSGDYRAGVVTLTVVDPGTGRVFDILSTGERFLAEHEVLAYPGEDHPYTKIIDDPFFNSRNGGAAGDFHRCEIEIDRSRGRVVWSVDGAILHEAHGLTDLPQEVKYGVGIYTLTPLSETGGSLHGQGARASWRNFEYSISD